MAISNFEGNYPAGGIARPIESSHSAVSWQAVLAGTVVAMAVTFILVALGSGVGMASVSPWPGRGASAATFTVVGAIWLVVVQWVSSALGGYTTGRLRTKWAGVHTHEVFFRDTAHGLVTWATATVFGTLLLAAAAMHTAGQGLQAAATASNAVAEHTAHRGWGGEGTGGYEVDKLFRSASGEPIAPERYAEAMRTLANAVATGTLSDEDRAYLAHMVAARSGISLEEAQQRVDDTLARIRKAADAARRAAAETSIYLALSMLIGAFIACAAAALGGKLRDEHL
jgi:hypothetical protein